MERCYLQRRGCAWYITKEEECAIRALVDWFNLRSMLLKVCPPQALQQSSDQVGSGRLDSDVASLKHHECCKAITLSSVSLVTAPALCRFGSKRSLQYSERSTFGQIGSAMSKVSCVIYVEGFRNCTSFHLQVQRCRL